MTEPTEKQAEIYRLILNHVEVFGFQPSYSELGLVLGISKKAVVDRLKQLEKKGLITLARGKRERAIVFHHVRFTARTVDEKNPDLRCSRWWKLREEK